MQPAESPLDDALLHPGYELPRPENIKMHLVGPHLIAGAQISRMPEKNIVSLASSAPCWNDGIAV
jgi:hypothetical protein